MCKKTGKRILSALLCAAVLAGSAFSASAAQLPQTAGDAASYSQRSIISDLVKLDAHAAIQGGNRFTKVYITIPEDATVVSASVAINQSNVQSLIFDGNTAYFYNEGSATDILNFEFYLSFPEGNFKVVKDVNSFTNLCGYDHARTDNCFYY